ncbi:hypothetical protein ACLB1O_04290 [Escherichia coli]
MPDATLARLISLGSVRTVGRIGVYAASDTHCPMPQRHKKSMALNIFSAPFLLMRGKEIPTQTFSFSVKMRPEQDDRA